MQLNTGGMNRNVAEMSSAVRVCAALWCVTEMTRFYTTWHYTKQELSYRKQIARKLRTQYFEELRASIGLKYYTVTLKCMLRVTQGHWKRNHWIDHTRLTISRVIWHWILLWPWNMG